MHLYIDVTNFKDAQVLSIYIYVSILNGIFTELPRATTPHITWFLKENVLNVSNSHKIDKHLESSGSRGVDHA